MTKINKFRLGKVVDNLSWSDDTCLVKFNVDKILVKCSNEKRFSAHGGSNVMIAPPYFDCGGLPLVFAVEHCPLVFLPGSKRMTKKTLEIFVAGSIDMSLLPDAGARELKLLTVEYLKAAIALLNREDNQSAHASHNSRIGTVVRELHRVLKPWREKEKAETEEAT